MRPVAIKELLAALSRRAGLQRTIRPHQRRHGFADIVMTAGGRLDEWAGLMGHPRKVLRQGGVSVIRTAHLNSSSSVRFSGEPRAAGRVVGTVKGIVRSTASATLTVASYDKL